MASLAPIETTADRLRSYVRLFATCFPGTNKFSIDYLRWLYADNPAGKAIGFDSLDDTGTPVAHYVCVPAPVVLEGRLVQGMLSLNTATHPDHRGQGLFTNLARATYAHAADHDIRCVFGVANANSTPGFCRKLGFQLVGRLDAGIAIGPHRPRPVDPPPDNIAFRRHWDGALLDWRIADPNAGWRTTSLGHGWTRAWGPGPAPVLPTYDEVYVTSDGAPEAHRPVGVDFRPHLHLGLRPVDVARPRPLLRIPDALRPSPLNLIFRDLGSPGSHLDAARVLFTSMDFDAY